MILLTGTNLNFTCREKSQTKKNFLLFSNQERPKSVSAVFDIGERKESRAVKELVPSNNIRVIVQNSECECDFFVCLE